MFIQKVVYCLHLCLVKRRFFLSLKKNFNELLKEKTDKHINEWYTIST